MGERSLKLSKKRPANIDDKFYPMTSDTYDKYYVIPTNRYLHLSLNAQKLKVSINYDEESATVLKPSTEYEDTLIAKNMDRNSFMITMRNTDEKSICDPSNSGNRGKTIPAKYIR